MVLKIYCRIKLFISVVQKGQLSDVACLFNIFISGILICCFVMVISPCDSRSESVVVTVCREEPIRFAISSWVRNLSRATELAVSFSGINCINRFISLLCTFLFKRLISLVSIFLTFFPNWLLNANAIKGFFCNRE